jgi:hypothetical protein
LRAKFKIYDRQIQIFFHAKFAKFKFKHPKRLIPKACVDINFPNMLSETNKRTYLCISIRNC